MKERTSFEFEDIYKTRAQKKSYIEDLVVVTLWVMIVDASVQPEKSPSTPSLDLT